MVQHKETDEHNGFKPPFGYNMECDAYVLLLRRSDGSFLAAFNAGVDPFEVERAVWEDAD